MDGPSDGANLNRLKKSYNSSTNDDGDKSASSSATTPKYKSIDKIKDEEKEEKTTTNPDSAETTEMVETLMDRSPSTRSQPQHNIQIQQQQLNLCQYIPAQINPIYLSQQHPQQQQAIAPYISRGNNFNISANYCGIDPINNKTNRKTIYKLQMFRFIEVATKRILFHLAKSAPQHKAFFAIFPILLVAISFIGPFYYRDKLSISSPPFVSYLTPPDPTTTLLDLRNHFSNGLDSNYLLSTTHSSFNGSNPAFDAPKRTSQAEFSIIISTKSSYDSVLTNKTVDAYFLLMEKIRKISIEHAQINLEWNDICREQCSVKEKQLIFKAIQNNTLLLKYPEAVLLPSTIDTKNILENHQNLSRIFIANLLGDVELDSDGIVSRSRSLLLNIKIKESLKTQTFAKFEQKLRQQINNFSTTNKYLKNKNSEDFLTDDVIINFWSIRGYVVEVIQSFKELHLELIFCFVLLFIFCAGASFSENSYQSRPFIGLQFSIILLISCLAGYGVHSLATGGTINTTLFPIIFIIIAIGILSFLYMQECWQRYSMVALNPAEKLAFIYSWDMPCFTMTYLVLIISSVASGLLTKNFYIQQCFFTISVGLTSILVFGLFYLTLCWYISSRREASGRKWFQCFKKGDQIFNDKYVMDYDELTCTKLHEKLADLKSSFARKTGRFLSNHNLRTLAIALIGFAIFCSLYTNGGMEPRVELREEFFVSQSATSAQFLRRLHSAYSNYEDYLELTFEVPLDYHNKRIKENIFGILRWALEQQYATKAVSWLMDFERFQKASIYDINQDTVIPVLSYVFLNMEPNRKYIADLVFDRFQTQITKSRMYLELSNKGISFSEKFVKELLQRAKEANLPLSIKAPYNFSLYHNLQVYSIIMFGFFVLIGLMTIGSLLLFTYPAIALCVPISCATVFIGTMGVANYFTIPMNMITLTTALTSNLFVMAVTLYFCYAYSNSGLVQQTNTQRVEYAFQCTLRPTFLASLALVLLYIPLLLNTTPIILQVWKILITISVLGFINYLFVLPSAMIILSDYLTSYFVTVNKMCDDNGCCVTVEQPADSIYFMPNRNVIMASSSLHPTRSIGSSYMGSNYIMNSNGLHLLPPTYDQSSTRSDPRLMLAAPIPSQPLPPIPQTEFEEDFNGGTRNHMRRVGLFDGNGAGYQIHEATDSNCDSLDSRGARVAPSRRLLQNNNNNTQSHGNASSVTSSTHQTPCRERRRFEESMNSASSLNFKESQNGKAFDKSKNHNEQIYEEPESPVFAHPRRGGRSNPSSATNTSNNNVYRGANHRNSGTVPIMMRNNGQGAANRGLPRGVGYLDSLMDHPNWRQYLLEGSVSGPNLARRLNPPFLGGSPVSTTSYMVSSPNSHQRRYD